MKNTKILTLLISTFILMVSCSEDGDDGQSGFTSTELVGTWVLVEVNLSDQVDIDGDGQSSNNLLDETECVSGSIIFNGDTTYQFEQASFTITSITNNLYHVDCYGTDLATGAWASDGSIVAFQGSNVLDNNFQLMGGRIIWNEAEELPGVASYVYEKQ
ncbi:MAG: DUF5004 domain-containing protein [Flavobacteriaceae bacterium]|nr:DUF5004 domain-containing protein [Flavobacteriaceae bacterium]